MKKTIDYTLYLVTDQALMSTSTLYEAVEQAVSGGCTLIQLREKTQSSIDFYKTAATIKELTEHRGIPLIVNDRIDIAMAVGADGVHMGQSDIPAAAARKMIGDDMILGVSVGSVAEAMKAVADGADYLGVGAMFPTGTKDDAEIVTRSELKAIRAAVALPIVVIGGINKENAAEFASYGVDGLAVVSAILSQPDIKQAAEEMKQAFARGQNHGL